MTAIDISYWNGRPDFAQVAASGVTLVIMKAIDAERGIPSGDSVYVANRSAARAQGLAVGAYLFNGPMDPAMVADDLFSFCDYRHGDVLAIDVEDFAGGVHWTPAQVFAWCSRLISAHGVPAGSLLVYMNTSVLRGSDWSAVAGLGTGLWVAQYGSNNGSPQGAPATGPWGSYALWQYTSVGSVPGIHGNVDMNMHGTTTAGSSSTLIPIEKPKEDGMIRIVDQTPGGRGQALIGAGYFRILTEPEVGIASLLADRTEILSTVDWDKAMVLSYYGVAASSAPIDSAALATSIASHLPAGAVVDVATIAAAVDASLVDNFAAIPGAVRNAIVK